MNKLNNPTVGILTVSKVTFYHGKDQVMPEHGTVHGAYSAACNGTFVGGDVKGWATCFIDADLYNEKVAGQNVACTIQILCTVDEMEARQNQINGGTYVSLHVMDDCRKIVKVTKGDDVAMAFSDECFPAVEKPERRTAANVATMV